VYALKRCLEFAKQPCYVIAHDVGWKIEETLPGGASSHVRRFSTVAEAREAFQQDPRGVFSISSDDAAEVHAFAKDAAHASLEQHGGTKGHPVVLFIDEVVSAGVCDANSMEPGFRRLIAERRHHHVGIISTCQSARMVNNQMLGLSTELVLFQLTMEKDLKRLSESGVPEDVVAQIPKLGRFQYLTVKIG